MIRLEFLTICAPHSVEHVARMSQSALLYVLLTSLSGECVDVGVGAMVQNVYKYIEQKIEFHQIGESVSLLGVYAFTQTQTQTHPESRNVNGNVQR